MKVVQILKKAVGTRYETYSNEEIVLPRYGNRHQESLSGFYCNMIIWSVARQRLGTYVTAITDTHTTIKGIVGNGCFYAVHAECISRQRGCY
jgi:hypothetical protein